jgi:N-acetylglutamate synthase-like GNAT family acetyltransferase
MSDSTISIRKATHEDLDRIMEIVRISITMLQAQNNYQWTEAYPARHHFEEDIKKDDLYVAVDSSLGDGTVVGMIAHTDDPVPEYAMAGCDVTEKCVIPHRLAVHPECRVGCIRTLQT